MGSRHLGQERTVFASPARRIAVPSRTPQNIADVQSVGCIRHKVIRRDAVSQLMDAL